MNTSLEGEVEHAEGEEDVDLAGDDLAVVVLVEVVHEPPLVVLHVHSVPPGGTEFLALMHQSRILGHSADLSQVFQSLTIRSVKKSQKMSSLKNPIETFD